MYTDGEFAQSFGLRDVMAPPTLICDTWQFVDSDFDETGRQSTLKYELGMDGLRAGNSYEFFQPVHPDDIVSARRKTISAYEKTSRTGRLLFWEVETSYSNQRDELLATNVETMFLRL
jgi:acyl dehydratase